MADQDKKEAGVFNVPLKKITIAAKVAGVFAEVALSQIYKNEGSNPVEAVYVFPMPEESSVVGCRMTIGKKKVVAELKEAIQARKEYDDAIAAGHYGGLLEQKRPNIFRMNVGGIGTNETVEAATTYNQRVPWQNNGGRFNIHLVVPPRFIPGQPSGVRTGGGWAQDTEVVPDASQITPVVSKDGVPYTVDITVNLSPGFPCKIFSPSHGLIVGEHHSKGKKPVVIEAKNLTPDRDFIICYQAKSDKVEASVHCGTFKNKQFAVIEVIPPVQITDKPKDVVFCLDKSGSMKGAKIAGLKLVAEKVIRKLKQNPHNRVGIVAFDDKVELRHPLKEINDSTFAAIDSISSGNTTYAGRALDYCFKQFVTDTTREKYILLVSDGQTEDRWTSIAPGVRVIAVGIDTAVNIAYLRDIAKETGGTSISVYPGEDYDVVAGTVAGLLSGPVLRNIKVSSEALGVSDVYQTMPGVMYLRGDQLPEDIQISGKDGGGKDVAFNLVLKGAPECSFSHQLWAREKLRDHTLSADEQIKISLEHGVLCSKTAFVAILLKNVPGQKPERIEVPVALPHTWDYDAVFGGTMYIGSLGMPRGLSSSLLTKGAVSIRRMQVPVGDHVSEKLEQLASQLDKGAIARDEAEKQWKLIFVDITVEKIKNWTVVQKAKTCYFLLDLHIYGFTVSEAVMRAVNVKPDPANTQAYQWWVKTMRYLGVSIN